MKLDEMLASIATTTALPKRDVKKVAEALFASIQKAVDEGQKVTVPGLGSFQKKERAAGERVNAKTGETTAVAAANFVVLKPSRAATGRPKKAKADKGAAAA